MTSAAARGAGGAVPMAAVVDASSLSSKVELFISCRQLKNMDTFSKSDPFVVVSSKALPDSPWTELMRTATIDDNLNPDFVDQLQLDYHFETQQFLRFDVYDRDEAGEDLSKHDFIGRADTTLAQVMGSRGSTWSRKLEKPGSTDKRGRIVVRGEEVASCLDVVHLRLSARGLDRKDWFGLGRSDPFFSVLRSREDGAFVKVLESEVLKRNLNPDWRETSIPMQKLNNGDEHRPLKVQVHDWNSNGSHVLIGDFTTSLLALRQPGKSFELRSSKGKPAGSLIVQAARVEERHSFLDYIRGGCDMNLMIGIDFTASNGAPSTPSSLHYQQQRATQSAAAAQVGGAGAQPLNEYQRAIAAVGEILQEYDSDGMVPVYAFGGQVNGRTNHCFPLTFDEDNAEVQGIPGVMAAYKNAFEFVSLSGPTLFEPLLRKANELAAQAQRAQSQAYTVLLLLTDGVLNDMDGAIDAIVAGSELPLSIVIVGVGNANFGDMEVLDADDAPLRSGAKEMARDIVQFVQYRKYANMHYSALAQETLAEIPEQLVSYFAAKGIKPNAPTLASSRHFNFSSVDPSSRSLNASMHASARDLAVPVAAVAAGASGASAGAAASAASAPSAPPAAPSSTYF